LDGPWDKAGAFSGKGSIVAMPGQPVCKGCGHPILGSYLTALNATWHPEHFVCAACQRPISGGSFNLHEGRPYHPACFAQSVAPRCAFCGEPLVGEFLVDQWGTKYCKKHQGRYPACAYCGRLVPPQMQESPGVHDAVRCPLCRKSAIEVKDEAQPIFKRLIQWVGSQGLRYNNLHLSLELCDRAMLAHYLQGKPDHRTLGATLRSTYSKNGRVVRTEVEGVAILQGLPEVRFEGVVIHELGHVWLVVHDIHGLPSWAEEGFCELLAYRYYSQILTHEHQYYAQGILNNPDPVYGEGFRRVRAIADRMGFQHFIEQLRLTKRLPTYL
jgi:hypothetical protein